MNIDVKMFNINWQYCFDEILSLITGSGSGMTATVATHIFKALYRLWFYRYDIIIIIFFNSNYFFFFLDIIVDIKHMNSATSLQLKTYIFLST